MKILLFSILFLISGLVSAQDGITFFKGTWEEALTEAKAQDKIIFLDAYAVWCGPCKRMSATVFTDPEVGSFYNDKFINVKMDMEKGEGKSLRSKYRVMAYPTLMYIDYTGKVVQRVKGARGVEEFIGLGKTALKKLDRSDVYAAEYEKGNRDPELVFKYVKALNNAGKPSVKIANEYLNSQSDLTTEDNLKFIYEATTIADSRIFDLFIKYRNGISGLFSEQLVNERILMACNQTVKRAIEFEDTSLLNEAQEKVKAHYPAVSKTFAIEKEMEFCLGLKDTEGYLEACKDYVKKEIKNDPEALNNLALDIRKYFKDDYQAMLSAEEISGRAAKSDQHFKYYLTYARILEENGKKTAAIKAMENCLKLVTKDRDRVMVERIYNKMKNS